MERVEIPVDLDELVSEIATVLEPPARKCGLELSYQREPDLPTQLLGDPGQLRLVLLNLMSYVLRFGAGSGVVLRVRDGSQPAGSFESLRFSIAQAGGGKPEASGDPGRWSISQLPLRLGGEIRLKDGSSNGELFSFSSELRRQVPAPAMKPASSLR